MSCSNHSEKPGVIGNPSDLDFFENSSLDHPLLHGAAGQVPRSAQIRGINVNRKSPSARFLLFTVVNYLIDPINRLACMSLRDGHTQHTTPANIVLVALGALDVDGHPAAADIVVSYYY